MAVNRDWHEANKMPRHATLDERIDWHLRHAANCNCRQMPPSIRRELDNRGLTVPTLRSLK